MWHSVIYCELQSAAVQFRKANKLCLTGHSGVRKRVNGEFVQHCLSVWQMGGGFL